MIYFKQENIDSLIKYIRIILQIVDLEICEKQLKKIKIKDKKTGKKSQCDT